MVPSFVATIRHSYFNVSFGAATGNMGRQMLGFAKIMGVIALCALSVEAQTSAPVVLPNTFTTVAGSSNGSSGNTGFTVGSPCSAGSPFTATDIYGDGCPATQAVFGPDLQDGVHVDGQGNIWIVDYNENWSGSEVHLLRKVDAKSGLISLVSSSANSSCTAATATTAGAMDSNGDGCIFANAKIQTDRGYGMDPYGNFLTGSYGSSSVRIFCNAVSPLCPIAAGVTQSYSSAQKQVGHSYRIAGCIAAGSGSTQSPTASNTAGTSGDGYFASPFWNLPGDVAAWGASNSSFSATATVTGTSGTCSSANPMTTGEINGSRGVTADQYGNVYISDGSNFRIRVVVGPPSFTLPNGTVLTNPLPAVIALNPTYSSVTAAQMYGRIYPMFGGFTATTKNSACPAGAVSGTTDEALDAYGDACPWFNSTISSANPIGLAIDTTTEGGSTAPNVVFADGSDNNLRVLYMGPTVVVGNITAAAYPMAYAILQNNVPGQTLTQITKGYVYLLAGNGSTIPSATTGAPVLGSAASIGGYQRIAAASNGNLYLSYFNGNNANIDFYDLSTGYVRELLKSSTTTSSSPAGSNPVIGGSAITSVSCATPGAGDGTSAFTTSGAYSAATLTSTACFNGNGTGSSTLGIAADSNNNLYIADDEIDTTGYGRSRVREVLATQLLPSAIGTPVTQTLRIHGAAGTTASATAIAASIYDASSSEISVATPVCATTADSGNTVDCLATVTFAPATPGLRTSTLALTDTSLATGSVFPLFGSATGSALVADPTAPAKPVTSSIAGTHTTPVGAAVDANGDVFTMDTTAGKFTEISGSTIAQLAGTLPSSPTQISLDPAGNLYAAGLGNSTLTKLIVGSGGSYTAATVSIAGVTTPQAVAADFMGNIYVADKTTTSVYKVASATVSGSSLPSSGGVLPNYQPVAVVATGLTSPTSLAIDGYGNLYVGDAGAGAIFRVDAKSGAMTSFLTGIHPAYVAADTAGDVYYQDSTAQKIIEIPFTTISSGVAGSTTVTVLASLVTPTGLAVAGNGNLYSADSGAGTLTSISRSALTYNFGTGSGGSPTLSGTLTNAGNLAATSTSNTNTTNFVVTAGTSNGCVVTSGILGAQAAGNACTFSANFVGLGSGTATDAISYLPAASTTGSMTLSGTLTAFSGTTTTLAPVGPTVLPGATVTLTATVASTVAIAGQTVTFLNGTTALGTGTTNSAGVATFSFTAGAIGTTYTLRASFAGTTILGASSSTTQTLTVALTPTAITLALSATTIIYPAQSVTLTATLTPAAVGETVSFLSGTTVIGTGTISSAGVATYTFTPTAAGTYSLTASFPSDGKIYAASVSTMQTLTVSAFLTVTPTTMTIAPGASGQVTVTLTPPPGSTGNVAISCTSPVSYVNCVTSVATVPIEQYATPTALGTISVATTTSSVGHSRDDILLAAMVPFGLLGLAVGSRKRKGRLSHIRFVVLLAALGVTAAAGIAGCSSGTSASSSGTAPSGTAVVTFTATGVGTSATATVTVTVP